MRALSHISLMLLIPSSFAQRQKKVGCDDGLIRGVNLGGWLLLEPWITPIFFEDVNVGDLEVVREQELLSS